MVSNIKSHHEQYYMDYQQFIKEINSNEVYKLIIKRVNASLLNKIEDLIIDHPNFNNIFEKDILLNFYPDANCVFSALQNSNLQLKIEEDIRLCKKAHALISNSNNFKNINLCEKLSESEYVVLFLGPTGAAKSTLISYLIKNELILYRIEEGIVLVNSPNNKAPIKIGEGDEKGTSEINIYQDKEKKIFYLDLPGLNDVDILERIRNAFEFKKLFDCKRELNIKLAFVIPNNYIFDTDRFQKLPSFFEDIKGIIPDIYNLESKFSNSLFIFSRGPRYQGEKNIKSKIEKAIKIRELSLEFEQFLGKLAEEFEDRITIFPAPNQENQDHIIFNELNTRHVYKDFHYREQIIKLLEKQKPIKLNEKDFNTVINNDKEIIQALNIYKYYSINKFNNLLYTINNYLNNNHFESLETIKILLEYLISDRVNYNSNQPAAREETLLEPIELAFQEYNKISNITINFQKILNQDSKEFLNNIQNEVNDKIEEIKNTIFELYFKYMLNYSQSLNELITNKIKEIGFDEILSTLLDVLGSFLKNNGIPLTQEQLELLIRNYGNIDVIEAFSKYFELRYNLYNKFIINTGIKYQIEAKNLIKEVDEYVLERILGIIDEYSILNTCYINLNNQFFMTNREFNVTEYFKQRYHTYEYWKAYELNENVQFKILKLFSICKNLKIQTVNKLEEIINSRLLDDESKCNKDYNELIQKIERTELTKEVTESKTCYFKGVVPSLSEVIGNSDNCRVIKIFGQYGIELDLETQISPPELRELFLIAPHTVLTKEKSSPIGNLNVNRLHFIASENEITLFDLDKQEGTVKLIRALHYPFSDFTKQNISLCEDLVSFQVAKAPLPRNNNIFINKVIFTSFVLAKNTFVGWLCGVFSGGYFNKIWKYDEENTAIIGFFSGITGIILVNSFNNPIYTLKSSFTLGSIGGVVGGISGKISLGNNFDAKKASLFGIMSGAIIGAIGINDFNKTIPDLIPSIIGAGVGGLYGTIIGASTSNENKGIGFVIGTYFGIIIGIVGSISDNPIQRLTSSIIGAGVGGLYSKVLTTYIYSDNYWHQVIVCKLFWSVIGGAIGISFNEPMQDLTYSIVGGGIGGLYGTIIVKSMPGGNTGVGTESASIVGMTIGIVGSSFNKPEQTILTSLSLSLIGFLVDKSIGNKVPILTYSGAIAGIIWAITSTLESQYLAPIHGATLSALSGMTLINQNIYKGAYWGSIVGVIPGVIVGFSEQLSQTALSSVTGGVLGILNGMYYNQGAEYSVIYMGIGSSLGALTNFIGKIWEITSETGKNSMGISYKEFYLKTRDNKFIAPGDNDLIFKIDQEDIDIENLNQYIWYQDETETLLISKQNNKCLQLNNDKFYLSTMCSYARAIYPEAKKKGYVSQDHCIKYLNYAINHDKAVVDTTNIPLKEDKVKEEYLEWLNNLGFDYKHNISFTYFNKYKQSAIEDVSVINERPNQSDKKTCIENLLKLGKYSEKPYQQGNYEVFLNKRILNSKGNLKKSEENEEILMILSEVLDLDLPKAYCEYIRLFKTNNQYNNFFVSDVYRKLSEDILAIKTNYFISSSQSLDDKSMRVRDLRQDLEEEGKSQVEINNEINIFLTNYNNQFSSWITGEAEKNIKAKEIELEKALSEAGIPMQQQLIYSARVQCNNAERNDAKTAFNMLVGDDRGAGKYEPLIIYRKSPLSGENNNNCICYNSIQEINFKFPWIVKELLNIEIFFDQGLESKDLQKSIEIRDKICKKVPNSIIIGFDEEYMSSTEKDSKKILAIKYNNYCGSLPWDNPLIHIGEEKYSYLSAREILIDEALKRSNTVVVYGIPGIDKTLFVSEYIRSRFTKDVNNKKEIWKFNAENSETLYKSFCKFAVFLGEAIENLKDLTPTKIGKLVEEKLATLSKYLNLVVIFDNVSNDLNKNDLKDYLKAFNKDVIKIITTQNHFSKFYNLINLEFESIELTPFTIKEAKEYLEKQFFNGKRSDTEQELKSLIDKVGVLPEHLEIASKYLIEHTEESIARYINGLNQNSTSFMTQSTFFKALNTLSQEAQIIVKCLSRMDPSYIHYDLLEKLAPDKDSQTLKDIITELKSLSLLNPYIKDNLNGFKMNSGIGHGIKISSKFTDNQIDEINQIYNHLINNLHGILNATNISGSSDKAIQYKHKEHVLNILENFESEQVELEKSCKEKLVELYNDLSKLYFNENDYKEALKYSLKAYELISEYASNNHNAIAQNIYDLGQIYQSSKLSSKAFELFKYSYFECSYLKEEPCIKLEIIRENILSHNINYNFKELNSRKFIKVKKFISDENLLEIRLKLQNIFANKIKEIDHVTVEDVKEESNLLNGMLNNNYIEEQLKNFNLEYSVNNMGFARMIAFETINLSIINSHERNCQKVKAFYQSYPEIVNKVAQSYPEFFVDEYIMFNCLEAIQSKVEFNNEMNMLI